MLVSLQVKDILDREKPDIILSQSGWSAHGLLSLNIPIICSIHDGSVTSSHLVNFDLFTRMHVIDQEEDGGLERCGLQWHEGILVWTQGGQAFAALPLRLRRPA